MPARFSAVLTILQIGDPSFSTMFGFDRQRHQEAP